MGAFKNPRMTAKERGLLKGAIRRVFSRSDLRRSALAAAQIVHSDPSRPRVKKWGRCPDCLQPTPLYLMEVDHLLPIVPIGSALETMDADELINRVWCATEQLLAKCKPCHKVKTQAENKARRAAKYKLPLKSKKRTCTQ